MIAFDPAKLGTADDPFIHVGTLACPTLPQPLPGVGIIAPYSLSIDRGGTAWVLYTTGQLFAVDVTDAACESTAFQPAQDDKWLLFDQAFSADTNGGVSETMFVRGGDVNYAEVHLGSLSLTTFLINTIASATAAPVPLTGVGDATLFGFFRDGASAFVQQIGKTTGISEGPVLPIPGGLGNDASVSAFAHFGGKFYVFITSQPLFGPPTTSLSRLDRSTGNYEVVLGSLPFLPLGAAVATCAPSGVPMCSANAGSGVACDAYSKGTGCSECCNESIPPCFAECGAAAEAQCTFAAANDACSAAANAAGCAVQCCMAVDPPPTCGNNVREGSEVCDGTDDGTCPSDCLPDCTCASACVTGGTSATCNAYLPGTGCHECCNESIPPCFAECDAATSAQCMSAGANDTCSAAATAAGCAAECCPMTP